MRIFTKANKLEHVLYDVRGPVVDEAARMEEEGLKILKLNIGNPAPFGFSAPEEVIQDMRDNIAASQGYSDSRGIFSARKAIMQYAQIKNIPNVTMKDVFTGNGASELIQLSLNALLNTGDEVLIPSPDYPLWTACTNLAGGTAVHYICDEQSDWYPDIQDIESKITPKTKAIVVINPNNPTGALYSKELLEQIVDIARRHELIIFSDEIYDRLVMDGEKHISTASLAPDLFCVTFSGLSKSHMVCGFRVGWMILSGNKDLARDYIAGINMLSNMRLCSNVPGQSVVQTALGGYQSVNEYIVPGGRVYEQREYIYKAINDIPGLSAVKPKAAFYIFPKVDVKKFNILDDQQFALDFLREKRVLIVPGSGFNWKEPDHFRLVYLPRVEELSVNEYIVPGGRVYEQREYIYKAINDIPGLSAVKPKAAFYIFPKVDVKKFNILDDQQFALDFLREKRVLIVPGSGFNWKEPDHFRLVYLPRVEELEEATGKLADFLSNYRQGK